MMDMDSSSKNAQGVTCMFFSEFDNTAGPKVVFEVPGTEFTSSGVFEQISSFIIPKPELASRQITIACGAWRISGYPIIIESPNYKRNALIFNMCFVFDTSVDVKPYDPIVKKIGEYLKTVEIETGFLSKEECKAELPGLMHKLLRDINKTGRCSIEINKSNTFFLKIVPSDDLSESSVHEYDVPILIADSNSSPALEGDLTTRKIVPLIDGKNCVHEISSAVDADADLVRACIQNMVFYKIAEIVPAFHHSNVYALADGFRIFVTNPSLHKRCLEYVSHTESGRVSIRDLLLVFGETQHGLTIRNLMTRHPSIFSKINEKKLCDFGVIHKIIRRVHKYPMYLRYTQATARGTNLQRYFNGAYHTEEIKIKAENDPGLNTLDEGIEENPDVVVCWK